MKSSGSPSSQKVDDFLSNISKISQKRLRENQRTYRDLQSDINIPSVNHSRSWDHSDIPQRYLDDFGVSQLSFNRSGRPNSGFRVAESDSVIPTRLGPFYNSSVLTRNEYANAFDAEISSGASTHGRHSTDDAAPTLPQTPQTQVSGRTYSNSSEVAKSLKPMKPVKPRALKAVVSGNSDNETEPKPGLPTGGPTQNQSVFGILRPVARKVSPVFSQPRQSSVSCKMPNFRTGNYSADETGSKAKYSTFMDIENKIQANQNQIDLSDSTKLGNIQKSEDSDSPKKKGALSCLPPQVSLKPFKPTKPSLKSFEKRDTEILKYQIKTLSPTKTRPEYIELNKEKRDSVLTPVLNTASSFMPHASQSKSLRPIKPVKPQTLSNEPEAIQALGKLKKSPVRKAQNAPIPEALQKLHKMKYGDVKLFKPPVPRKINGNSGLQVAQPPKRLWDQRVSSKISNSVDGEPSKDSKIDLSPSVDLTNTSLSAKKPDFQARLAGIIRSSTTSGLDALVYKLPSESTISRARTLPETRTNQTNTKTLIHANKTRARGPRRKLPKSAQSSSSEFINAIGTIMDSPRPSVLDTPVYDAENMGSKDVRISNDTDSPSVLAYGKIRKIPPPKGKKPNFDIEPTRKCSGEIFI